LGLHNGESIFLQADGFLQDVQLIVLGKQVVIAVGKLKKKNKAGQIAGFASHYSFKLTI
jgi:hypothetical protein